MSVDFLIKRAKEIQVVIDNNALEIEKGLQDVTLEALRFADRLLRHDYKKRPLTAETLEDKYWTIDLD